MMALYPPEYGWLNLWGPLSLLFIVGYGQIYGWARKVVMEGRTVSRTKTFLAVFILCLISAFLVMLNAYDPYLGLPRVIYWFVFLSVLDFFPIYILLRRKLIRNRWYYLACTGLICSSALMWFLFPFSPQMKMINILFSGGLSRTNRI